MKQLYLFFSFLLSTFAFAQLTPPSELQAYYSDVDFSLTGNALYDDLAIATIAKHTTFLSYPDRHDYLYDADEDLSNSNNVILVYSGESRSKLEYLSGNNPNTPQTFNTEHIYPRSLLDNSNAEGDLYHLRSCDIDINSNRANKPFSSGSGSYTSYTNSWYPGDEWKGDVARMVMYINLRYNEPFEDVGTLNLFLQWNAEDPVSSFEDHRNSVISAVQGNRNPFIDNPYLATVIWGGTTAENRWDGNLSTNTASPLDFTVFPNPAKERFVYISATQELDAIIYNVLGKEVLRQQLNTNKKKIDVSQLSKGVYLIKLSSDSGTITKKLIKQ